MIIKKETGPFALLRGMTSDFDRFFEEPHWPFRFAWPRGYGELTARAWVPEIDVFERDNSLVTKIDLPGLKKEDVKVEVVDGVLTITGERENEAKEEKKNFYRCERTFGAFTRAIPLPDGVAITDVKATFVDGVLEVTVPLSAKVEAKKHVVEIAEGPKAAKAA